MNKNKYKHNFLSIDIHIYVRDIDTDIYINT